jgi:DNA-binding NtrC family response regulator
MRKPAVLIAADDAALRRRVRALLLPRGCEVFEAVGAVDVLRSAQHQRPDLIVIGPFGNGAQDEMHTARQIRRADGGVPLILIPAHSTKTLAIAALRAGINDYFKLPVAFDELAASVRRCLAGVLAHPSSTPYDPHAPHLMPMPQMVGESPPMQGIKAYIGQVALTDSTVLITGESGTGKELVAEMIHRYSSRHSKPLVGINCAAIPDSLLESQLFGYERGAFTGANALKEGQLQLAHGGTVFLDEIGDMSPYAQAKILRAIESKTIYRLGGKRSIPVDVRIIAATNHDIEQLVAAGKFRADLYFRLNVGRIHLPPVRQRKENLPALLDHYLQPLNRQFGLEVEGFTDEVWACLFRHHWPGNIREVKYLLEAIFINLINLPSRRITFWDLPEPFRRQLPEVDHWSQGERERVLSTLLMTNWNMSQAAQQLCWSRMTLYRKVRKYQIVKSSELSRFTVSATPFICPSLHVGYIAPPSRERPQDDMMSCATNGSKRCIDQGE